MQASQVEFLHMQSKLESKIQFDGAYKVWLKILNSSSSKVFNFSAQTLAWALAYSFGHVQNFSAQTFANSLKGLA